MVFTKMYRKTCDFFSNENFIAILIAFATQKQYFSCVSSFYCSTARFATQLGLQTGM